MTGGLKRLFSLTTYAGSAVQNSEYLKPTETEVLFTKPLLYGISVSLVDALTDDEKFLRRGWNFVPNFFTVSGRIKFLHLVQKDGPSQ